MQDLTMKQLKARLILSFFNYILFAIEELGETKIFKKSIWSINIRSWCFAMIPNQLDWPKLAWLGLENDSVRHSWHANNLPPIPLISLQCSPSQFSLLCKSLCWTHLVTSSSWLSTNWRALAQQLHPQPEPTTHRVHCWDIHCRKEIRGGALYKTGKWWEGGSLTYKLATREPHSLPLDTLGVYAQHHSANTSLLLSKYNRNAEMPPRSKPQVLIDFMGHENSMDYRARDWTEWTNKDLN